MFSVAKLGFARAIIGSYIGTYIDKHQEILSSSYKNKFYNEETYKKARCNIAKEILTKEVDSFIKFLVKGDVNFSHITNDPFRYFSIDLLEEMDDQMPDFLRSINEIFDIFITLRFDHTGSIRENIAFKQAAEITENIASKIEPSDEALSFVSQDPLTIVRYLDIISEKVKLPHEAVKFLNSLKNNIFPSESGKFVLKDVVTANILLDIVLSRDNHAKKLDCYKELREIISEILSLPDCHEEIKDFFINLPRDGLIKLIHYKSSFLKLLESDKHFSLKQVSNIILQLVDPYILDLTLRANDRNDSPQEIENFIIDVNVILSNSPANVYSQTDIDDFIEKSQIRNDIVCGNLPDYVRCLKIYSIYYHSHPIFYHLLNRLIQINTLSLEQIRKFIQIIASDTTNIVNNDTFTGREFLFNDFRNIILNQKRANFGADYIICYLLDNNIHIEEIGKLFSGLLKLRGYCGLYQLLYEEYHLLNTSVQLYYYMKDNVSLSIKEFAIPFISQFINEIEEFDHDFWHREYIPDILKMLSATLQNAPLDVTINILVTLKSELQHCYSYRDIVKHAFVMKKNCSGFWSEFVEFMECPLGQQTAQQILNDKCGPKKVKTLIELSMNQLTNNIASSALEKIVNDKQPSSSICDIKLSGNMER